MSETPRITPIDLKKGKPTSLNFNRPVKFKIVFVSDTYIEGIIPPNSGFTICNYGDIAEFSVVIDDESVRKLGLVPSPEE